MNSKTLARLVPMPDPGHVGNDEIPLLLTTKITAPRRGRGILPRPRLEQYAEHLGERRISILKAPPGFGKTTLATIWAERLGALGHAVAWLSLDAEDDNPQRLLYYLAAALNRACPQVGNACLGRSADLCLQRSEVLASLLIEELSSLQQPLTLFIDDYHCIDDAVLTEALSFLVHRAPGLLHLVFVGRRELPEGIVDHYYADERLEIDSAQLRFELEETRDLMRKGGVQPEQGGDLNLLQLASDGWIAALRAYLLTPGPISTRNTPRSLSNLFDDVLRQLDEQVRLSLYLVGLLDKFSAGLLQTLLGGVKAHELLGLLRQRQLFVTALDDQHTWFSLHPLFRDHLREGCLRLHEPLARECMLGAAHWFAEREIWLDAIRLGLAAGAVPQVREWIEQSANTLIEQGDFSTLVALEKRWKLQSVDCPLSLKVARAWAMGLSLEHESAMRLTQELEAQLGEPGDDTARADLYWEVQSLKVMLWALDDRYSLVSPLAFDCYAAGRWRPWTREVLVNVIAGAHLRACRWEKLYALPPVAAMDRGNRGYFLHACYRQSLYALGEYYQGRVAQGMASLDALLEHVDEAYSHGLSRPNPVLMALPRGMKAYAHYLRGEQEAAEVSLQESMPYISMGSFIECIAFTHTAQVRLLSHQERFAQARRTLDSLESVALARDWPRLQARALLERVRLHLLERKVREAQVCCALLQQLAELEGCDEWVDRRYFALLARLWLALDAPQCEASLLDEGLQLLDWLQSHELWLYHTEMAVVLGLLLSRERGSDAAEPLLLTVLEHVRGNGAISLLIDVPCSEGAALWRRLCPVSLQSELSQLLGDVQEDCSASLLALTVKERQVVQLVAEGKSNKQIARDLSVTPETIKSHMKSIFAKLKVDNRAQAAVMLQQLAAVGR